MEASQRLWTRADWGWFAAGAASLILSLSFFIPWRPYLVHSADLDDSWMLALNVLFASGAQFGRDVVFTYGPWGFLDTRCYYPQTYALMVLGWAFFAFVFWRTCWVVSRRHISKPGIAFVWLTAILGLAALGIEATSATLLFLTAVAVVYFFNSDARPWSVTSVLLVAAVALASLVKFSYFIAALLAIAPIAVDQLRRKQAPSVLLLFGSFYLGLYLLAGQRVSSLGPYLRVSTHLAAHYTDAMSYATGSLWQRSVSSPDVPPLDLFCFLFASSLLAAAVVAAESRRRTWACLLPLSALGGVLFMIYKWGYVRHEMPHAPLATMALLAVAILYLPPLRSLLPGRRWGWRVAGVVLTAAMVCGATVYDSIDRGLPAYFIRSLLAQMPSNFACAIRLGLGASPLRAKYADALAEIRNWSPAPQVQGTVDVYPWNQSVAIAYGLPYRPRPVFQSYCAYSPELARINVDYLRGPRAPDAILFDVAAGPRLQHFPPADDGPSWPELLTRYDFEQASRSFLLLRKSSRPRAYALWPIPQVEARFDTPIAVPTTEDGPVWVQMTIEPTVAGRILSAAYKDPELFMTVTLPGGHEQRYRLIAGEAKAGFLLSPVIANRQAFAALASPQWRQRLRDNQVMSIRLSDRGWIGKTWAYRQVVLIKFYHLRFDRVPIEAKLASSDGPPGSR